MLIPYFYVNSLQHDKNVDSSKLKVFADDNSKVGQMREFVFDRVERHCGKTRQSCLPAFSTFPTIFSKWFQPRIFQSQDCLVKG